MKHAVYVPVANRRLTVGVLALAAVAVVMVIAWWPRPAHATPKPDPRPPAMVVTVTGDQSGAAICVYPPIPPLRLPKASSKRR